MGQQNNLTIPTNEERILAAVERAKRHVARQALLSAGTTFVPIPGVDMLLDVTVLIKMMEQINQEIMSLLEYIPHSATPQMDKPTEV